MAKRRAPKSWETKDATGEYDLRAKVELVDGEPACVRLVVARQAGGDPVTAEGLRRIALGRLIRESARRRTTPDSLAPSAELTEAVRGYMADAEQRLSAARASPRALDEAFLAEVARVYREALAAGLPPTATVADHLGGTRSAAGRWVMEARRSGLLGEARGHRAGEKKGG